MLLVGKFKRRLVYKSDVMTHMEIYERHIERWWTSFYKQSGHHAHHSDILVLHKRIKKRIKTENWAISKIAFRLLNSLLFQYGVHRLPAKIIQTFANTHRLTLKHWSDDIHNGMGLRRKCPEKKRSIYIAILILFYFTFPRTIRTRPNSSGTFRDGAYITLRYIFCGIPRCPDANYYHCLGPHVHRHCLADDGGKQCTGITSLCEQSSRKSDASYWK